MSWFGFWVFDTSRAQVEEEPKTRARGIQCRTGEKEYLRGGQRGDKDNSRHRGLGGDCFSQVRADGNVSNLTTGGGGGCGERHGGSGSATLLKEGKKKQTNKATSRARRTESRTGEKESLKKKKKKKKKKVLA